MLKKMLLKTIHFYQLAISPLFPPRCRFMPTCSCYTYEAISRFGIFKGIYLGTVRLCKCHPFHPGGFDPVPEKQISKHKK